MDVSLDKTTRETIALMEARLLRIEHVLFGSATPVAPAAPEESVAERMAILEREFNRLVSRVQVYGELLDLYDANHALFDEGQREPAALPDAAVLATVLASASSFSSTASALTAAVKDHPVPEATKAAVLVQLAGRIRATRATQLAQAGEAAALRVRSEAAMRRWYEVSVLRSSGAVAEVEGRLAKVEAATRRQERLVAGKDEY